MNPVWSAFFHCALFSVVLGSAAAFAADDVRLIVDLAPGKVSLNGDMVLRVEFKNFGTTPVKIMQVTRPAAAFFHVTITKSDGTHVETRWGAKIQFRGDIKYNVFAPSESFVTELKLSEIAYEPLTEEGDYKIDVEYDTQYAEDGLKKASSVKPLAVHLFRGWKKETPEPGK